MKCGESFEKVAGLGADEWTMLGAGARAGLPVLVTIPQLVGGGALGQAMREWIVNEIQPLDRERMLSALG